MGSTVERPQIYGLRVVQIVVDDMGCLVLLTSSGEVWVKDKNRQWNRVKLPSHLEKGDSND